ncbi:MAG: ABC transporter ATP-binding protein [Hyphomicrobiales bacterium]|nr:ABC transporter ATP-binding protein [Hyphomicrobiales bacterium]
MNGARPAGDSSQLEIRIGEKAYPGANGRAQTAVRGLELAIERDSFTVLIGPSGCGKTTILRILAGLDTAYEGTVQWSEAPRVGFVFQEPQLLPWRSVRQNISLTAAEAFSDDDLRELAEELGLADVLDRFPGELSLGLARRVSLARAFASLPNVLLLDEPFVSLDEPTAARLRRLLVRVWSSRPTTAVLVTHNLREALELADRLVLLTPGPASVLADIRIDLPRESRDEDAIEALRSKLVRSYPAQL